MGSPMSSKGLVEPKGYVALKARTDSKGREVFKVLEETAYLSLMTPMKMAGLTGSKSPPTPASTIT